MSIAAVLAQVSERKDLMSEHTPVDYLSMLCTSAVRESLTNVFGDKFDAFARNFEKSFGSTLRTIRLIRSSNLHYGENRDCNVNVSNLHSHITPVISSTRGECTSRPSDVTEDCTESVNPTVVASENLKSDDDVRKESTESRNQELTLMQLGSWQLAYSEQRSVSSHSMLSIIEKSVIEQTRANELKSLEIGLSMKRLQLKETQLALSSDLNFLERCKLHLGVLRTSFKAEKFKNQLEETEHGDFMRTCADFLVADLFLMVASLFYGVYSFSSDKVRQFTASCSHLEEAKSWWRPMASFNSGWQTLSCQVQVYSRIIFGVSIMSGIAVVLVQRAGISRPVMPITFLILLLGVMCGAVGKFCVDTVGGDGYLWLIYWETMCIVHFFANVFTRLLYYILHGAVQVSQATKCRSVFPFWARKGVFYIFLLILPVCCGLLPFASPKTWWEDHFSKMIRNHMLAAYDETYDDGSGLHE